MKKILALALALMMALGMFAVASADTDTIKIGILAPDTTHGWVGGVAYYAEQAAEALKTEGVTDDYVYITAANAEEMASGIETLVNLDVDGIVVWPQFSGVASAAEAALDAGVVIYNFDMMIEVSEEYKDNENLYVLTGDNYGMGERGAEYISEKLGGAGKVFVLNKPAAGNVNDDRCNGFTDKLAELDNDIEIIGYAAIEFSRENDLAVMTDVLTANPEIDAVYSLDDETSIGALQAIKEAGRTDIKVITGGGGCQEYFNMMLEEEYADIWVASATYSPSMIIKCVENLVKVLQGEEIEHLIVDPTTIVDRDNAPDFLDENTPY